MSKKSLIFTLISLLASAGATADTASGVSQLPLPVSPKAAQKMGGYCSGYTLRELNCGITGGATTAWTPLPGVTSVSLIYERGWRVVSDVINPRTDYHFIIIEEQ